MTIGYPITTSQKLEETGKAGWFRRQTRGRTELLKPDAHQVLVYRVDGQYLLDADRLRRDDEQVVQATHVSVVDMRRDAPMDVRLTIPSADAAEFEVIVTFTCTVTDPVAVVRGGVDARQALESYLRAHRRTFELGLDYPLSQVNDARRVVAAQIKAYVTIKPPSVPGMTVTLASVEVTNPEFLTKFEAVHRDKDVEQRLARLEQENQQRLTVGQVLHDHSMQSVQQEHDHRLADRTHQREQAVATSNAQHQRQEQAEQAEFERDQFDRNMATIGGDPRRALMAAFASGRIDAPTLADQLKSLDDHEREVRLAELDRHREDRREMITATREDLRWDREEQRRLDDERRAEQRRLDDERRAEQRRLAEQEREDRLRQKQHEREDRLRREANERQDAEERLRIQFELLKQAAKKGQFDMVNLQADRLYAEVMGLTPAAVETPHNRAVTALAPANELAGSDEPDDDEDEFGELRDDDATAQVHEDDD